ncbi:undecaprenyl diphosphate synthase family protein [bacterium]|nr:MAG: undecaprenyl diphosphate synthase family protein [bacterium]
MAERPRFSRLPRHVGFIPDGNRRWARERGLHPSLGYAAGLEVGLSLLDECLALGIEEASVYGFTMDNTKRPKDQRIAFAEACAYFVNEAMKRPIALQVVGESKSHVFPEELKPYVDGRVGDGALKVNMLVNYGWNWDLQSAVCSHAEAGGKGPFTDHLASKDVSRIDLVVRWGGMRRLSGFLPIQSVYADFYVVEELWPDYEPDQFHAALDWYAKQDVTLGG